MPELFTPYPILLAPFYSPRPWGGQKLAEVLEKDVPETGGPYGEAWELSDHPDGYSTIANGPLEGRRFGDATRDFPVQLLGLRQAPARFPLLVKYIDAAEDLSVQVHPTDRTAPPNDRGKTECWLVMQCGPGAEMVHGLKPGIAPEDLRRAAESGDIEPAIRRVPLQAGDFVYIPAGTVHATLRDTLLCEVQQSSNTTYRLWDWARQPERALHIEQAVAVTDFARDPDDLGKRSILGLPAGELHTLVRNEFFHMRTILWNADESAEMLMNNEHGLILNVVAGDARMKPQGGEAVALGTGQTWFLPAGMLRWSIEAGATGIRLLVSESLEL